MNLYKISAIVPLGVIGMALVANAQTLQPQQPQGQSQPPMMGQQGQQVGPQGEQGGMRRQENGRGQGHGQEQSMGNRENRFAPPMVLTVDEKGHVMVRGTLASVSGTSLTITSWGMTFVVDMANAEIAGKTTDVTSFTAGDIIGVQGTLSASTAGAITAKVVRDWGTFQSHALIKGLRTIQGTSTPEMFRHPEGDQRQGTTTQMMPFPPQTQQ